MTQYKYGQANYYAMQIFRYAFLLRLLFKINAFDSNFSFLNQANNNLKELPRYIHLWNKLDSIDKQIKHNLVGSRLLQKWATRLTPKCCNVETDVETDRCTKNSNNNNSHRTMTFVTVDTFESGQYLT